MMEVISNEITTVTKSQNTIPFKVNFDSILEKYEDHKKIAIQNSEFRILNSKFSFNFSSEISKFN